MNIINNLEQIQQILQNRFLKSRKSVRKNIALAVMALIKSESCSLPEIAVQMSSINDCTVASNELRIIPFITNNYTFRQNNFEDKTLKKNQSYQAIRMVFI